MCKITTIFIAALIAIGCSAPVEDEAQMANAVLLKGDGQISLHSSVSISEDFTPEQQELIIAAVDTWRADSHGLVDLKIQIGDEGSLKITVNSLKGVNDDGKTHHLVGMQYNMGPGQSLIEIDLEEIATVAKWKSSISYDHTFKVAVAHEIGHALGIPHLDTGLMMSSALYSEDNVDSAAMSALCSIRGCK